MLAAHILKRACTLFAPIRTHTRARVVRAKRQLLLLFNRVKSHICRSFNRFCVSSSVIFCVYVCVYSFPRERLLNERCDCRVCVREFTGRSLSTLFLLLWVLRGYMLSSQCRHALLSMCCHMCGIVEKWHIFGVAQLRCIMREHKYKIYCALMGDRFGIANQLCALWIYFG